MNTADPAEVTTSPQPESLVKCVAEYTRRCLRAYEVNPALVLEHANIERATAQGGYGRRQIYELVQNAADALQDSDGGRIHVVLTEDTLYCANEGEPIDADGIGAIMSSHVSKKRGTEIGRFGLGFKSVLEVSHEPRLYGRVVSFGFSAARSERAIKTILPSAERTPVLRLAWPLDLAEAKAEDPVLDELITWATTVVKLPLQNPRNLWLDEDIGTFPAEFLLFTPHVGCVVLDHRPPKYVRSISLQREGNEILLNESGRSSKWRVFSKLHVPSSKAQADAGELADRESVPVMWAVPLEGAVRRGQFWAFFPTEYLTTLSGIANAPWKTNEDRQNLLRGPFNDELIDEVAQIVAESVGQLQLPDDPARYLDLIPARGRESANWADDRITQQVYDRLRHQPCLPDQNGTLRTLDEIQVHPLGIPSEALEAWASSPDVPSTWVHRQIETRERRSRVERLLSLGSRSAASVVTWLEDASHGSPAGSIAAVKAASALVKSNPQLRAEVEKAHIVLTSSGTVLPTIPGTLFLPSEVEVAGLTLVHRDIAADAGAVEALAELGIGPVDAASELEALVTMLKLRPMGRDEWNQLWLSIRKVPNHVAEGILKSRSVSGLNLLVMTRAGGFRPISHCLLPGPVASDLPGLDDEIAIDTSFHRDDLDLLIAFGAVGEPTSNYDLSPGRWFEEYLADQRNRYMQRLGSGRSRPDPNYLNFSRRPTIGPIQPIVNLSEEGKARFTEILCNLILDDARWLLGHDTRRRDYPSLECESPYVWVIKKFGRLRSSLGMRAVSEAVSPLLRELKIAVPVADCSERVSDLLGLPSAIDSLDPSVWEASFAYLSNWVDVEQAAVFYSQICCHVPPPKVISCRHRGDPSLLSPDSVTVLSEDDSVAAVESSGHAYLVAPSREAARDLSNNWGLLNPEQSVRFTVQVSAPGDEQPLLNLYPGLAPLLGEGLADCLLVPCEDIWLEFPTEAGRADEPRQFVRSGDRLYWKQSLTKELLLHHILAHFDLSPDDEERSLILQISELNEQKNRRSAVRAEPTLAARLLRALGTESLRQRLPSNLLNAYYGRFGPLSDLDLAELVLVVYGYAAIHEFRHELEEAGLQPPASWRGSVEAKRFVQALGFPDEYAGFDQPRRRPIFEVDGPILLPDLHNFQGTIKSRVRKLLTSTNGRRGLLSLPTGAGKTRVAVQSLIEAHSAGELGGPVIWVAQSDELCEQAVQSWGEVWRAHGPSNRLQICRLWSLNEASKSEQTFQVVVATIQKLQGCMDDPAYEWLRSVECVVIDEAHYSTEKSYTAFLEWVGLGRSRSRDRASLLGLTATPFRGSEEETIRLVRRYGGIRLDEGVLGDDPYRSLQEMGVLARVRHRVLQGVTIDLNAKEMADLQRLRLLPASAGQLLGRNQDRNNVLLDAIASHDENWPILLFAASVEHAQSMAALLVKEGIKAAAISGSTEPGARRRLIEAFRAGEIQVLTNYAVLTAGFDAPSIRALYIARPTYSPVVYQQMIGRGLRGPKNGGKDECLIVNVEDTIREFGEELAFRKFEFLWQGVQDE